MPNLIKNMLHCDGQEGYHLMDIPLPVRLSHLCSELLHHAAKRSEDPGKELFNHERYHLFNQSSAPLCPS